MLRGFKDFIMRGNVVDLAVGIVIGAAFTGVVTAFTNGFIQPLIKVFTGGKDPVTAGAFTINGQPFDWAAFINAVIGFLIVAAVLYFLVVMPINKLAERRARGQEPRPTAPSEEILLLREIRDALAGPRREVPHPDDRA
jgi:large conductance mechanosensitive channel